MAKRRAKGEGSIYFDEKNGRWLAKITLPNGKRRTKSGKTKKQVTDWLLDQRTKANEGLWVADERITFGAFLARYMEDVAEHSLRPTTLQGHYSLINNHIEPALGKVRLTQLGPHHIQRFYAKNAERRAVKANRSVRPFNNQKESAASLKVGTCSTKCGRPGSLSLSQKEEV
jgi:hypothetical protein